MAKQGGMGDQLYIDGFNVGGDIGSLSNISAPRTQQDVTPITKFAFERIQLLRDGHMTFNSFFNDDATVGSEGAFQVLKTLPMNDRIVTYQRGMAYGAPAASMVSKQINYDGTRAQDGSLTYVTTVDGNAWGLEWGEQITPGRLTQGAAGNGTGIDFGAVSTLFGWSAYLHVLAFTGTSITASVQDSADNATFATLTGGSFTAATGRGAERIQSASPTATVRRYVRISTAGTFTNAVIAVNFVRGLGAP